MALPPLHTEAITRGRRDLDSVPDTETEGPAHVTTAAAPEEDPPPSTRPYLAIGLRGRQPSSQPYKLDSAKILHNSVPMTLGTLIGNLPEDVAQALLREA